MATPSHRYKDVTQMTNTLDKLTRLGKLLACIVIGAVVVWRGNAYNDTHTISAIPQLMCAMFAIAMAFTGFALANEKD